VKKKKLREKKNRKGREGKERKKDLQCEDLSIHASLPALVVTETMQQPGI
jgi:hypothetical protein